MRSIAAALVVSTTFSGTASVATDGKGECPGPTRETTLAVVLKKDSPPTFEYTLTNGHSSPIILLNIGTGATSQMVIIPDNIPSKIMSPEGWSGKAPFGHESSYMHIQWSVSDVKSALAAKASLSGFVVEMPVPRPNAGAAVKGSKRVKGMDMLRAPFQVWYLDRSCAWGTSTPTNVKSQGEAAKP